MRKPSHPGRTPTQRRILDEIGCGNYTPTMTTGTRKAMLADGLIEPCGFAYVGTGPLQVRIQQYQMPIAVHMKWCDAVAEEFPDA